MTPKTACRWGKELHLSANEKRLWRLFASRGETTMREMVAAVNAGRETPYADVDIRQMLCRLRGKLGKRGSIGKVYLFELELHPGRR